MIETQVNAVLLKIARRRRELEALHPGDRLDVELGLDSLDLAELVATLELELGVDPFASRVTVAAVRTVGDLHATYRQALTDSPHRKSP